MTRRNKGKQEALAVLRFLNWNLSNSYRTTSLKEPMSIIFIVSRTSKKETKIFLDQKNSPSYSNFPLFPIPFHLLLVIYPITSKEDLFRMYSSRFGSWRSSNLRKWNI